MLFLEIKLYYNKIMRVISGKYRGKMLKAPTSDNIRPTGDKVKQALFTKLQFFIDGRIVVDLFCGSGALGIEALSRNAKRVYFVDKDIRSIKLAKQNLIGIDGDVKILNCDYKLALGSITEKVDLFLIDPPYASGLYDDVLKTIFDNDMLSQDGIIVCEHPCKMIIDSNFETFDIKKYGTVSLTFLRKKDKNKKESLKIC